MTRAALFLASPLLFPGLSPLAVWLGLCCLAVGVWVLRRADDLGGCETTLRAMEAGELLEKMQPRRWV